ncbi:MAG: adenylyl-sulfate kinase [Spirochaetales bacterium]|nr:adenylyl-sulfate kinase [Spirochaetales bacterium]
MNGEEKTVLRFLTCGSVDDGKSTLIGHLLAKTGNLYDDQIANLEKESSQLGNAGGQVDYSLLLDGLEAERHQGITIDVAYRYFETPKRKFIVADTPGHEQYTRNMATGASLAQAALILVDATRGVLPQTRRHALICSQMGIPHLAFVVNKMDLAGWNQQRFDAVREACLLVGQSLLSAGFNPGEITVLPVSALLGDQLTTHSDNLAWFQGPSVLEWLETRDTTPPELPLRLAVQGVLKLAERRYTGRILGGSVAQGDRVELFPSGKTVTVKALYGPKKELSKAEEGASVALVFDENLDVERGDGVFAPGAVPPPNELFKVRIVWMQNEPLIAGRSFDFQSIYGPALVEVIRLDGRFELGSYQKNSAQQLGLNEVGEAVVLISRPLPLEPYGHFKEGGSFLFIDRKTNATAGCGMVLHPMRRSQNVVWQEHAIDKPLRAELLHQKPLVVWLTGLSGSGKSTLADLVERSLYNQGYKTMLLDGDNLRHGLNKDLGFTERDRVENIRRSAEAAKLLTDAGLVVLVCLISPYREDRKMARVLFEQGEFVEVWVDTPLEECERRDPKGLYKKARAGLLPNFTGINSPYEKPEEPEIHLKTSGKTPEELANEILEYLKGRL